MSRTINGRKPAQKATPSIMSDDIFGNALELSNEIRAELKRKGLVPRWISYKKLVENQGFHPKGWTAYKRSKEDMEKSGTIESSTFLNGSDPDGYIRRGESILAVKTVAKAEEHRNWLAMRAQKQKSHSEIAAEELRATARSAGMKSLVDDQPDEDEE